MFGFGDKSKIIDKGNALPGRAQSVLVPSKHHVNGRDLNMDVPKGHAVAVFAMGCFWGVERMFWDLPGVWLTMVGNIGGVTPNPTYEETCTGNTGHTEAVRLVFDPDVISFAALLQMFWEGHDPTQGMRQGNDRGTQYRSGIYATDTDQLAAARLSADSYGRCLLSEHFGAITTEITMAGPFYLAEEYHQQYLSKNPAGYCGIGGTGVLCPIGAGV